MKLTYFNLRARGEPARLILEQAGVAYEDHRIESPFVDAGPWMEYKPSTPYGQLPVLKDGDVEIAQSMTIARYIANKHGLGGNNALESAQMDEIVDALSDATNKQYDAFLFEKDENKKKDLQKAFNGTYLPTLFSQLEKRLAERGCEYLAAGRLSWADICFFHFAVELPDQEIIKGYKLLNMLYTRIANLPKIKCWVDRRPKTAV